MNKHILVIDDEQSVRDAFELALEDSSHDVTTAQSGPEGLTCARQRRPDLIFLDLRMPGMDGVETMRQLHQIDPKLQVYVITAFHQVYMESLRQLQTENIHFQVAKKPLGAGDIREIVHAVLERPEASGHG